MTDNEFETYLELLGRLLRLSAKQRAEISLELRDHLEERSEELLSQGLSPHEAIRIAVEELGDAGGLAEHFVSINQHNKRRWAMRFATFSIVGCFIAALLVFSLWPDQDRLPLAGTSAAQEILESTNQPRAESVEARNERTRRILENTIFDFNVQEIQFTDLISKWRDTYSLEFYLDESSDLKGETPVTADLRNIRLTMALELLMRQYNSEYIIRDGIILIASTDEMSSWGSEIKYYDCRDLVSAGGQIAQDPANLGATLAGSDTPTSTKRTTAREIEFTRLITASISSGAWEEEGRSAVVYDGVLVVNNTAKVHDQVKELLTELRRITRAKTVAESFEPK